VTASLVRQLTEKQLLTPRVNWGRWIVDCPACSSALAVDPEWGWFNPQVGAVEARGFFRCWDCGLTAEVEWPPDELVYGAERLLMMRPDPKNRNFDPKSETLNDLMWENGAHGIFENLSSLELSGGPDGLLTVEDGRIRHDRLPLTGHWVQHDRKALER
jgi:hypothetical protein